VNKDGKDLDLRKCTVSIPETALKEEATINLSYNYNRSDESVHTVSTSLSLLSRRIFEAVVNFVVA